MKDVKKLKIAFAIIAVISAIIIAMPNTISLFGGQHGWYGLGPVGSDVPCEKCHGDIVAEMEFGLGPHMGETGFGRMECEHCHRVSEFTNYTFANGTGDDSSSGVETHSAATITCMDCHGFYVSGVVEGNGVIHNFPRNTANLNCICHQPGGSVYPPHADEYPREDCVKCHGGPGSIPSYFTYNYIPGASGFGLTDDNVNDTGSKAAHKNFVLGSDDNNSTLMEGTNEACVACHTNVTIGITYNTSHRYEIELNKTCDWEVGDFLEGNYTEVVV